MSEYLNANYQVRDPQGNVYGPATGSMLRDWVGQGRIVAGMHIADVRDGNWVEVSQHPALADLFGGTATQVAQPVQGYNAPQTTAGGYTPQPPDVGYATPNTGPVKNMPAFIGMITGIVAVAGAVFSCVPLCGCLGIPLAGLGGVAAIVLGAVGMVQIKKEPEKYSNRGQAMAGLIMGIAAFVLLVAVIIISIVFNVMNHR